MTTTESLPLVATATMESYRDALHTTSEADRAFASEVSNQIIEVVKAFSAVKGRLHTQANPDNIDFALLIRLSKSGPMRASDLADKLCSDPSTVSRQVAALVKAGLLERQADPDDGRASILVPTAAGLARIDRMLQLRGQLFAPIVAHWSDADRITFSRLLTDFAHGLSSNLESVKNAASDMFHQDASPSTSQGRNA